MAQSGNRPPRRGQPTKGGSRTTSNGNPARANSESDVPAAERARERLAERDLSGQKSQTASQRARSAPTSSRTKAQAATAQRSRSGGPASRRGSARAPQKRSTAMTVGIFGTVLVVLVVLVIVLVGVTGNKPKAPSGSGNGMTVATRSGRQRRLQSAGSCLRRGRVHPDLVRAFQHRAQLPEETATADKWGQTARYLCGIELLPLLRGDKMAFGSRPRALWHFQGTTPDNFGAEP